ncbi:MAG: pyridoxal phosphate-dependent aminotransferase [Planctomycetes bacterium]|nr:pyridoxal phosphate-dependent aminotransferase [Planctomycetota bacterium]MCB9826097.1 pyridoxal phosphate-dependent aminotransferase [Planctomycetota bacterium]MCB9829939.1 pyridoxal phosphate-dependent aminotransferase [Planctomycetota bacterium]MCB9900938.1 pyridoxal phosphate-dependent aminotransferase [Planctomycetota bacterium]
MRPFSPHAGSLPESETLAIAAAAKRLKAAGVDVAPFAAGEPDFDTPEHVKQAAIDAIRANRTRYGPAAGLPALREAVAEHLRETGYAQATPATSIIAPGAKGVLYLGLLTVLSPGDEVIVPAPAWLSYRQMVQAAGARTVFVETDPAAGYVIDPDRVRAAITPRTRVLIVNSPGNPTGAVQPAEVLRALGDIAVEHDLAVISDEIYEKLVYAPATFTGFTAAAPAAADRTLIVNGVSKAYAMTGWRIGYGGGPAPWIDRMIRLQSHALSGPAEINQAAALAALTGPQDVIDAMRDAFHRRRDVMMEALGKIPNLPLRMPEGAFYVFPDVSAYLGRAFEGQEMTDAPTLAAALLEHAHAAVVPGDAFEAPYAIRLSYACCESDIRNGVERMGAFLARLDPVATR